MTTELRSALLTHDLFVTFSLLHTFEPLDKAHLLVQGTASTEGMDIVQIDVLWKVSLTEMLEVAHHKLV